MAVARSQWHGAETLAGHFAGSAQISAETVRIDEKDPPRSAKTIFASLLNSCNYNRKPGNWIAQTRMAPRLEGVFEGFFAPTLVL